MALKFTGLQLLQTNPSVLLNSASTASVAFWVEVNPANNVADPNGVEVFGDSGGKFAAKLVGTSTMILRWSSCDGQAADVSTCSLNLIPGSSYHVASTWRSGMQCYYLNGVLVGTDFKSGSLGVPGVIAPSCYRIGSDKSGVDVTLDQPTIWVGYLLTASDVTHLLHQSAAPSSLAASSIALAWSLGGQAGASAAIGDPGLHDSSSAALNLLSIVGTAPTYQAAPLAYTPRPTCKAAVAPSGRSIVLVADDGSGVETNFTSIASSSVIQSIQMKQLPDGGAFTLSFQGQTTATIPVTTSPPVVYGLWTFPTIPGHAYNLAVTYTTFAQSTAQLGFETINGSKVVALEVFSDTGEGETPWQPVAGFHDPGQFYLDGVTPVPWKTISSGVVATGTTMQVRITGGPVNDPVGNSLLIDGLRVQDSTASTIAYYDDAGPNLQCFPAGDTGSYTGKPFGLDGSITILYAPSGIGSIVRISPGSGGSTSPAQVLQAALESLPTIGTGNVLVTDDTALNNSYVVTFAGNLSYQAQPLLTSTDPNVLISQVEPGEFGPTLSINGGSPITLLDWVWSEATPIPVALSPLHQAFPASQTFPVIDLPYSTSDYWDGDRQYFVPNSVSGAPTFGWSPNLSLSFTFPQVPPGTYEFAITWPHAPFSALGRSCVPSSNTHFSIKDGSGAALASYTVDQTLTPSDPTTTEASPNQLVPGTITVPWKILGSVTTTVLRSTLVLTMTTEGLSPAAYGQPQPVAILDAVQLRRTSADDSVVIGPDDVATISIPANWAVTQAGQVAAVAGLPVAPPSPTSILPLFVDEPKTLEVGSNMQSMTYYTCFPSHSNLFYLNAVDEWSVRGTDDYPNRLTARRDGNNNVVLPVVESVQVIGPPSFTNMADPWQGTAVVPDGLYVMTWDGDPSVSIQPTWCGVTITDVTGTSPAPTGARSNWRIYHCVSDPTLSAGPRFTFSAQSTTPDPADQTGNLYVINISNVEIYPPDPADSTGQTVWGLNAQTNVWTRPPLFHPWFLDKLQSLQSLRFLDVLGVNTNSFASLAQFKPTSHSNRSGPTIYNKTIGVTTIQAPTTPYFPTDAGGFEVHVSTTTPHGLWEGSEVFFKGCGTAQLSNNQTYVLDDWAYGLVHVLDPTNIVVFCNNDGVGGVSTTNVLTGGSLVVTGYGTAWPLSDIMALAAAVPSLKSIHFQPAITTDVTPGGGAYQIGAAVGASLPRGMTVHVECGNECWNDGFVTKQWCRLQNLLIGSPGGSYYGGYYALRSKQIHDQFQAGMASVGRGGDMRRIMGTQASNPAVTDEVLQQCQAIGAHVDEVCTACYYSNWPISEYSSDQVPIYNRMTVDQLMDNMECMAVYGGVLEGTITPHFSVMQARGYAGAKVIAYEAAPDLLVAVDPVGDINYPPGVTPNFATRQQSAKRHPRMYGVQLHRLQQAQDLGLARWNHYNIGGATGPDAWGTYEHSRQQPGTGDPGLDTFNATAPLRKNQTVCEVAGALRHYASLYQAPAISPTKPTQTLRSRNGTIRSYGYPRGMFRLIRGR